MPLPVVVKKVLSDHAGSSLGEFRHVILAMLDTYSYDTAIHRYAVLGEIRKAGRKKKRQTNELLSGVVAAFLQ